MRVILAVAVASALGGLTRYLAGGFLARRSSGGFPWETFVVNISGACVLGFLFAVFSERLIVAPWLRAALLIGFLGSYTTFSTWTLESYRLIEDGAHGYALANLLGSLAAGMLATFAGVVLDESDRIEAVLPLLDEMIPEGLITLEKVRVIAYRASG